MEIEMKTLLTKNKKLSFAIRTIVVYLVFLLSAKYFTTIYEMGIFSNNIVSIIVIAIVWLYRFLTYAIIPAIIFLFLVEKFSKKTKSENNTKKVYDSFRIK